MKRRARRYRRREEEVEREEELQPPADDQVVPPPARDAGRRAGRRRARQPWLRQRTRGRPRHPEGPAARALRLSLPARREAPGEHQERGRRRASGRSDRNEARQRRGQAPRGSDRAPAADALERGGTHGRGVRQRARRYGRKARRAAARTVAAGSRRTGFVRRGGAGGQGARGLRDRARRLVRDAPGPGFAAVAGLRGDPRSGGGADAIASHAAGRVPGAAGRARRTRASDASSNRASSGPSKAARIAARSRVPSSSRSSSAVGWSVIRSDLAEQRGDHRAPRAWLRASALARGRSPGVVAAGGGTVWNATRPASNARTSGSVNSPAGTPARSRASANGTGAGDDGERAAEQLGQLRRVGVGGHQQPLDRVGLDARSGSAVVAAQQRVAEAPQHEQVEVLLVGDPVVARVLGHELADDVRPRRLAAARRGSRRRRR